MESLLCINENNLAYSSSIEVLVCSFIELIHFATVDSLIITYMNNKKGDFFFSFSCLKSFQCYGSGSGLKRTPPLCVSLFFAMISDLF